jgi:hypothetical protein
MIGPIALIRGEGVRRGREDSERSQHRAYSTNAQLP